jgi:hypothetical protein
MKKKGILLTQEQRENIKAMGIPSNEHTTEGEVLSVLRKKKFENFGRTMHVKV